jgi:transcriptional regulator
MIVEVARIRGPRWATMALMYVPPAFAETEVARLHEAIRASGLATLVTLAGDGLFASHVPLLLETGPAPYGTLLGHLAAANPQTKPPQPGVEALAIFLGPDAYVSPGWYKTKEETGKVVPTWNYVAIHAYGTLELFDDAVSLRALVARLTDRHEAALPEPWSIDDAPESFVQSQLKGIVGFRLPISRLQGKWKMSQNRPPADREGVVKALSQESDPVKMAVAALIKL